MKDYKRNQFLNIIFIIISVAVLVLAILIPTVPVYIRYFACAFLGFTLSMEFFHLILYKDSKRMKFLEARMSLWNSISYRVKKAGEVSFNELPIGIIVINNALDIDWSNNYAKEIFMSPLTDRNLKNLDKNLAGKILDQEKEFTVILYGRSYSCSFLIEYNILYLTDITDKLIVSNRYKKRMLALGIVNLDNFEESMSILDPRERSIHVGRLIGILNEWASNLGIGLKGYTDERYLLIMDYTTVEEVINNNFTILDEIKDYCIKANLRISASIGISCSDINAAELLSDAYSQLELALNRGGNQAVVKINDHIEYFGAKTESFESRTSISIRFKTEELCEMIIDAKNVIIMSHKYMDADAFGASIGLYNISRSLGREAKIVFEESLIDDTVSIVYDTIKSDRIIFLNAFINIKDALSEINDETLLIIVDCQYLNLVMDERIYKRANPDRIAAIDHHRRNTTAINPHFLYAHPSASSSVELVVEMFSAMPVNIELSEIEATWMLMGIAVDTNNFVYRTSYRTFLVLAKLETYGAKMATARKYLREDFNDYVKKTSILYNMEIVDGVYGITLCDDEVYQRAFLAKIADNMIGVKDISIAFCIGKIGDDLIGISARSLIDSNVQVIMEKLGGGGHFNNAAAQIKGITMEEAKEMLIKTLRENREGEENQVMKIILTTDVKGKGKVNEIIDIPAGHANFLIRSKQAIEATPDNVKHLEYEKMLDKQKQEQRLKDMQELKTKIEQSPIKIAVKVGQNGKLFGSVSSKQIAEEFINQYGIEFDRRKILHDKEIDALGSYKISIQLHKEVTATITLYIVEK